MPENTANSAPNSAENPDDLTRLLAGFGKGDPAADALVIEAVYEELRSIARGRMRKERDDRTLQATALVHEAYQRLVAQQRMDWRSREHFFAMASTVMRRILIDRARRRRGPKQGGGWQRVEIDENRPILSTDYDHLLAIDQALTKLALLDERQAQVVEMSFFGGYTQEQIAEALNIHTRTVKREWRLARVWMLEELASRN